MSNTKKRKFDMTKNKKHEETYSEGEKNPIEYDECNNCHHFGDDIAERQFLWHYRPRAKYKNDGPCEKVFRINLCIDCYNIIDPHAETYGWDWWDAFDGLIG